MFQLSFQAEVLLSQLLHIFSAILREKVMIREDLKKEIDLEH
jgi:hypothetical protein